MKHLNTSIIRRLTRLTPNVLLSAVFLLVGVSAGSAQVVERGVQGALIGAGIGAITGGGRGAGKGALIGGAAGVAVGAVEKNRRDQYRRPATSRSVPPPRYSTYSRTVADVQRELTRLGYDPGPVDGQFGSQTKTAVRTYQEDYNLVVDGRASGPLLDHMVQQGGGPTG
jgi:hypothetical protein